MTKLILGKEIAEQEIYPQLETKFGVKKPVLVIFYNPKDKLGTKYIEIKQKAAQRCRIAVRFEPYQSFKKDLKKIHQLNRDSKIAAILLQLPLPKKYTPELIYAVNPKKDVDGLFSKFYVPPVVRAVERALKEIPYWQEKSTLVVGQGEFVGKKIFSFLKRTMPKIQAVDSDKAFKALAPKFEIVISCVGKPNLINEKYFQGIAAIDVGTMVTSNGKIVGDVDPKLNSKLQFLAPVPGGVGPMTVAYLMDNVWKAVRLNE
ncbi:MAG: bifunctional 5,10-methylenetetrahydrofolate dehydrogenase/5,10-methenyltetrahydrofolate cyclohydrolase [Patescibacteria group bacterium]|nr:bifunctional 5,10-methylenetetrahydrofolate dehydrogenase/5,10-methenyltetrahydrofolate cyclohydrolase [Patescibacteria group bacterium]